MVCGVSQMRLFPQASRLEPGTALRLSSKMMSFRGVHLSIHRSPKLRGLVGNVSAAVNAAA